MSPYFGYRRSVPSLFKVEEPPKVTVDSTSTTPFLNTTRTPLLRFCHKRKGFGKALFGMSLKYPLLETHVRCGFGGRCKEYHGRRKD